MLKTNAKKVREEIKKYVDECINAEAENYDNTRELMEYVVGTYNDDRTLRCNLAELMTEYWAIFTPYYSEMRELIKTWLDETDEQANAFSDDKVIEKFYFLIERELQKYWVDMNYNYKDRRFNYSVKENI